MQIICKAKTDSSAILMQILPAAPWTEASPLEVVLGADAQPFDVVALQDRAAAEGGGIEDVGGARIKQVRALCSKIVGIKAGTKTWLTDSNVK
jgi:hypothetical protein